MITLSVRAAGLERDGQGIFAARCPACSLVSRLHFSRKMQIAERQTCRHFLAWYIERGIGIFFSFGARKS